MSTLNLRNRRPAAIPTQPNLYTKTPVLRTIRLCVFVLCLFLANTQFNEPGVRALSHNEVVVTTTADTIEPCTPQACSLRAAISLANAAAEPVTIQLPAGVYRLTRTGPEEDENQSGDLDITAPVTISGAGAQNTIIDADGLDRVFHLRNTGFDPIQVFFEGITIRGGEIDDSGGAILVASNVNLRLERSVVRDSLSTGGDGGGGIYIQGSSLAVIRQSTLMENESTFRGGAMVVNGELGLENSTVSGNRALVAGGIYSNNDSRIRNATIAFNTNGGLVVAPSTTAIIGNTIIADNPDGDCQGDIDSNGFSLVGTSCPLASFTSSDIMGEEARLAPLALNGAQTPTHALLADSPAIDSGDDTEPGTTGQACFASDQRGVARPIDGNGDGEARCDIGAFEFERIRFVYLPSLHR